MGQMVKEYVPPSRNLAAWLETNAPEGLTFFHFPVEHRRRRLRTNNGLERLNARSSVARESRRCFRAKPPCSASPPRC